MGFVTRFGTISVGVSDMPVKAFQPEAGKGIHERPQHATSSSCCDGVHIVFN